jgi:hypothetical protein
MDVDHAYAFSREANENHVPDYLDVPNMYNWREVCIRGRRVINSPIISVVIDRYLAAS